MAATRPAVFEQKMWVVVRSNCVEPDPMSTFSAFTPCFLAIISASSSTLSFG